MVVDLKTQFSSLKMNKNTVIELKATAKQRGIEGYYKLRKAELIHKLKTHKQVNEQVPGLEIARNTTRSVNISAVLDQPILDDNTPVLKPTQKFFSESVKKIKVCWNWLLDYIPPKPQVVGEALELFKNPIRVVQQERHFLPIERVKICVENCATRYRIDGKDWIDSHLFLVNSKQSIINFLINTQQTKLN